MITGGGKLKLSSADFVEEGVPAFGAGGINGQVAQVEYRTSGVVLSSIGARCGKCFYADGEWTTLANTQVILPDPEAADPRFLWWQLNDEASWHRSGTAQPFIKPSDVRSRLVAVPPLAEQRRIATILDRVDALRTKRRESLALLNDLGHAIYEEMFGRSESTGEGALRPIPLEDLAVVSSGITMGRKTSGATQPVPYVTVVNVQDRRLDLRAVKTIEATESEIERYRLRADDLLLTEGGDPDKLGRGTLWRDELELCIHQNHVFRVRVTRADLVDCTYLNWHLGSRRGKSYFLRFAKQTTGIASINSTQLKSFPVLLPPLSEQLKFSERVAAVVRHAERGHQGLRAVDGLVSAVQQRAFRGEL